MTLRAEDAGLSHSSVVDADVAMLLDALAPQLAQISGSRVLIAGGGGFLLSMLVDVLVAHNERSGSSPIHVTVADNFSTGSSARLQHLEGRSDFTALHVDITKPLEIAEPADFVVQGASIASPVIYRRFPVETIEANVWGTKHLLDYARQSRARSFVFMSSSEIYGDPVAAAIPTPETYAGNVSCTGPRACYDESKRLGETLTLAFARQHEINAKIVRPFNVYGPRLSLEDGRIIPDLLRDALAGQSLRLYSDGSATRSFCYLTDEIDGIIRVLVSDQQGEAFNIGNDQELSIRDVAELMADVAGTGLSIEYEVHDDPAYLTDNPNRRCPDLTKSRELLGFDWRVSPRDGLERTLRHYQELGRVPVTTAERG